MRASSGSAPLDSRTKRQARELQTILARLLKPPVEPHGHPFEEVELSPREIQILLLLGDRGELMMGDLAVAVDAPISTLTRVIDRLKKKRLVERSRSEEDRRIVIVKEGGNGKILRHAIQQSQFEMAVRMLAPLTAGEREILLELMGKLIRGLAPET